MGQDCKFCGAYVAGRADKCPACGKRINYKEESKASYTAGAAQAYAYAEPEKEPVNEPKAENTQSYSYTYNNNKYEYKSSAAEENKSAQPSSSASGDSDARENQAISFLCYLGLLFLIPYLTRPNSEFVKFHSNQGLVLLITSAVIQVAAEIVPIIGWLIGLAGTVFVFALFLKGMINVYHLEKKELPYIGSFKLLK